MKTLIVSTPVGPFNRKTDSRYTFVNVWASPRAAAVAASPNPYRGGVDGRWVKDRGFAVTWHGSEANARKAAAGGYQWDNAATLVGTFPVDALPE